MAPTGAATTVRGQEDHDAVMKTLQEGGRRRCIISAFASILCLEHKVGVWPARESLPVPAVFVLYTTFQPFAVNYFHLLPVVVIVPVRHFRLSTHLRHLLRWPVSYTHLTLPTNREV